MMITFTALQLRLIADSIKHKNVSQVGALCMELAQKVEDNMTDDTQVGIVTTVDTILDLYPLLNGVSGEIDNIRTAMKQGLLLQITQNVSTDPENPNEWNTLAEKIQSLIGQFELIAQNRIDSGKIFLQSLRVGVV